MVRVVDEAGEAAPPGQPGELQVSGPTAATGYWRNLPKSRATFADDLPKTATGKIQRFRLRGAA